MREYSYQATEASVEALRHLKSAWVSISANDERIAVGTADGAQVLLSVERASVEDVLEVLRMRADVVTADDSHLPGARELPVEDLGRGRNDVVLFSGETWAVEAGGAGTDGGAPLRLAQFSGRAGQRPAEATIACATTDAVVVAASTGEGMLIRLGVRPMSLAIERDRVAIARFLVQRGYAEDDPR